MKLKHSVILFGLLLCLSSCSTKIAYNYLDWAIQWKARSLVPLNSAQKQQTKLAAIAFHNWHQSTQLPQYADYLSSLKLRLQKGPISGQEIHDETDKVQVLLDQSINQVLPDIVKVTSGFSNKQTEELLKSYRKERENYIDDYVDISPKKQLKKRFDDLADYLTPWFGSLSKKQKSLISQWAEQLKPYEKLNALQQETWESELATILKSRSDRQKLTAGLKKLLYFHTDDWEPELEAILDHNQDLTYELLSSLINDLSAKQKRNLYEKLDKYIKICRELAEEKATEN